MNFFGYVLLLSVWVQLLFVNVRLDAILEVLR